MKKRLTQLWAQIYAKKLERWGRWGLLLLLSLGCLAPVWGQMPAWSHPALGEAGALLPAGKNRRDRPSPDSIVERQLLPQPVRWVRERFRYGVGEGLSERQVDNWLGQPPAWQGTARETFDLRQDGQALVARTFSPTSSGWFLQRIDSLSYDAAGNLAQRLRYGFGGPGAAATPYERERYERDGQGRVLRYFRDTWEQGWQPWLRIAYSYGAAAFPLRSRTAFWVPDSGAYRLAGGADFSLSQGRVDTATYALVDSLGQWTPDYRDLYTYLQQGQEVRLLRERWQAGNWAPEERRHWVYDPQAELVSQEVSLPDGQGWQPYRRYERVLRAEPLTRYRLGFWTGNAWAWEQDATTYYPLTTAAGAPLQATWRLFPNPARDQAWLTGLPPGPVTCRLYSAGGRLLWQQVLLGSTARLPLNGLPAGSYWVHIQGVGQQSSGQLWLQP